MFEAWSIQKKWLKIWFHLINVLKFEVLGPPGDVYKKWPLGAVASFTLPRNVS
jgi:hypothetical protein